MLTGYLYINFYNNTLLQCVRCVRAWDWWRVCGGYLFAFAPVMLHVHSVDVVSRNK